MHTPMHSKAPWSASKGTQPIISAAGGRTVAVVYDQDSDEAVKANATLIEAAPELLAACHGRYEGDLGTGLTQIARFLEHGGLSDPAEKRAWIEWLKERARQIRSATSNAERDR